MAHEHAHGEVESTYFTDQILTVIISALLGGVALMMWNTNMLSRMLVPEFWWMVCAGGIVLLVLSAIRAVAVWQLGGQRAVKAESPPPAEPHGHEHSHAHHDHGHDHGHSHSHAHEHADAHDHAPPPDDHDEGDVHDHGWSPWKYAVLIVPVVLYALNLPNESYSKDRLLRDTNSAQLINQRALLAQLVGSPALLVLKNSGRFEKKFSDLANGAASAEKRQSWEGQTVVLKGQFRSITDRDFTLFRVKMSCCSADEVILNARIIAPEPLQGVNFGDWIQVEGELEFMKVEGKSSWVPVVRVPSIRDIKRIEPEFNPGDA